MLFLKLLLLAYLVAALLTVIMVFSAIGSKTFRLVFIALGLVMPGLFLYAVVASIFAPKPVPCFHAEIAKVEDDIESERVRIFGGERVCPSFSKRWESMYEAYLERLAMNAVRVSEKIASIAGTFRPSRFAS